MRPSGWEAHCMSVTSDLLSLTEQTPFHKEVSSGDLPNCVQLRPSD